MTQIAKWSNCQMIKLPNDRYTVSEFCPFKNFSVNIFPQNFFLSIFFSHPPIPPSQFFTTPRAIWYDEARRKMPDYLCWHPSGDLPTLDQIISGTPPHTWSYLTILAKLTSRWGPPHTWSNDLFRHLYQWDTSPYLIRRWSKANLLLLYDPQQKLISVKDRKDVNTQYLCFKFWLKGDFVSQKTMISLLLFSVVNFV